MSSVAAVRSVFLSGAVLLSSAFGCQGEEAPVAGAGALPESAVATRAQALTCTSLVPFMTSDTLPSGVVTRSGAFSASYEAWRAFDSTDTAASMWISQVGQTPAWLGYQWADGAKRVTHYAIRFVNGSLTSRAPRNWTLQGWNGSSWVVVDTRPNEVGWLGFDRREYTVASPGSFTQYRLHVLDDNDTRAPTIEALSIGRLELLNCIVDTQPPAAPVLTGFSPASPSSNTQPVLAGTAEASSTVRLFSGTSCAGTPVATVAAGANGGFSSPRPVTLNATSTFTATATDAAGNVSPCSTGISYLHDGLAPAAPVLTGFNPVSPSFNAQPLLSGTAEASSTVRLFSGASCTGTALATLTATATGTFSSSRPVTLNSTSTFTATSTDAAGNVSACSPSLSYRHDNLVPAVPALVSFTPASPSNSTQPVLSGTAEPGVSVRIFTGTACSGVVLTVTAAADGTFSAARTVTANTTTTFTTRALDAAGNQSACSTGLSYRHDNVAPTVPTWAAFNPASPGQSLTPELRGTTERGASVRIFPGAGCTAGVLATVTADASTGAFASILNVLANAPTGFSARAVDAVGNLSACSATATYVHDTVAPAPPVFAQDFIPFDAAPIVGLVSAQTESRGQVRLFSDAACTIVAPPGLVAQADASGTAQVSLTQAQVDGTVFAVATDAAGNRSSCVSFEVGCAVGFADCDGNPVNGCESDLLLDEANCGGCGTTCGGAPSANGVCGAGTCGLGCVVGTFDCDGVEANGCESATACSAAVCQVDAPEELLINALSVVEDPVRTTGAGAWTFGTLMRAMNGGADPSELVRNWLRTWEQDQFIEATFVPARPFMRGLVLGPWEARSGGPNAPLDFNSAPFRLLAIVNRMDLRSEGVHAGEGRFVFGVLDPAGNATPFTVILEYTLPGGSADELQRWSRDWHELGRLGVSHPDYNVKLQAVTDRFTKSFVARGRFLGSAISQVRTNENALEPEWELREFHFGPTGLAPAHVALTPAFFLNNSPMISDYILQNRPAILAGTHDVPQFFQGQPFLWGSALTPFFFFWNAPGVDSEARHQFSLNTCNGCHAGETQTFFLHIGTRNPGQTAFPSPFMVSTSPTPDPITGAPRVFNDLGRRQEDLKALVCGTPVALAKDVVGESLLAPARRQATAVPGFPARSNLPAGRVH